MPFPTITVTPGTGTTINTLPNAGQAAAANSLPVVLASDQGAVPVSGAVTVSGAVATTGAFFQATQPVSLAGAVALAAGSAAVGSVTVSNFPATQPVSGAVAVTGSVAVTGAFFQATQPVSGTVTVAGASTAANQATEISSLAAIATNTTGAATAANQAAANTSLSAIATSTAANATATAQTAGNATLGSILTACQAPTPAGTNLVGKVGIDQTTPGTTNAVQIVAGAAGGCTPSHRVSTADTNSFVLKASAGHVYGYQLVNANAAARYVKFYNAATAVTAGVGTPAKTVCVPGGTAAQPTVVTLGQPVGLAFAAGIAVTITANLADADATAVTAGDLLCEVDWK